MKTEFEQKIHEFAEQMYKAGYEDRCLLTDEECLADQKRQYEKGLNDAWECIKKMTELPHTEREKLFGDSYMGTLIEKYSASEAIAIIKEYEEKQKQTDDEIKVGDEVIDMYGDKGCVTAVSEGEDVINVLYQNGYLSSITIYTKTGRHFPQIAEVLKQMKEDKYK